MQQLRNGKTLVLEPKPEEIEGLSKRFKVDTVLHCRVTLTSSGMPGMKNCVKGRIMMCGLLKAHFRSFPKYATIHIKQLALSPSFV
jgi:hypothetical protein